MPETDRTAAVTGRRERTADRPQWQGLFREPVWPEPDDEEAEGRDD